MALTRITKGVIKPNENYDTHNINSTGIITAIGLDVNGNGDISGNLSVGGVLTYEDVTSIDSVGIITAQSDIHVGAGVSVVGIVTAATFKGDGDFVDIDVDGHTNLDNVSIAGVSTFSGNINLPDNVSAVFGTNSDGSIKHTGTNLQIFETNGGIQVTNYANDKDVDIRSDDGSGGTALYFRADGSTGESILYNYGTEKLKTTNTGINVTGNVVSDGLVVDGNSDLNGDLDVDGHTNLDNVSIAGVATVTGSSTSTLVIKSTVNNGTPKLLLQDAFELDNYVKVENADNLVIAADDGNIGTDSYIKFKTDNVERVRIAPDGKLHVGGFIAKSTGGFASVISTGGASNNGGFQAHYNSGAGGGGSMTTVNAAGGGLDFWTYTGNVGSEAYSRRLRIDSGGIVTINYGNSTSNGILKIAKDSNGEAQLRFETASANTASIVLGTDEELIFKNVGTETLRIDSSGRVIIANSGSGGTADVNADNFVVKNYTNSGSCGISILNADNQNSTLYFGNASDSKHAELVWSDAANLFLMGTSNSGAAIKLRSADQSDAVIIDSSQRVGVGTMSPDTLVEIGNAIGTGTANLLKLTSYTNSQSSRPALVFWNNNPNTAQAQISAKGGASYNASKLHFSVANSSRVLQDRACIDEFGTFIIGPGETRRNTKGSNQHQVLLIEGNGNNSTRMSMIRSSNDDNGPEIQLIKTRGTSVGSVTKPNQNDYIGSLVFIGGDDTDLYSRGAEISVQATGTPANDRIPSDIIFSTTPTSGATSPQRRLRITSEGRIGIDTDSPQSKLNIVDTSNDGVVSQLLKLGNNSSGAGTGAGIQLGAGSGNASNSVLLSGFYDGTGTSFTVQTCNTFNGSQTEKLRITNDGQLIQKTDKASGYIAEFHQDHASNSAQILIDSPTNSASRPSFIELSRAGTLQWSIGQGYNESTGSFHFATSTLGSGVTGSKFSVEADGDISIPTVGAKIYTNNSGGNLTIQGGASYPGSAIKFNGGTNGGTGNMHLYAGQTASLQERMTIAASGRIGMSQTSPDAATLHIGNSYSSTSSNVALQVGTITGQNRYLTINHFGNQQNFSSLKMRVNDNALVPMLDMGNPYGSANHGTKIKFSGYQDSEVGAIESENTAANSTSSVDMVLRTGAGPKEVLRLQSGGDARFYNGLTIAKVDNDNSGFSRSGYLLGTPAINEYVYTWSGHSSYTIDLTCASYFSCIWEYFQHQTNGGSRMQQYARGKWSNNHYQHTLNVWEWSGSGGGLTVGFTASDQGGNGSINGLSNMSNNGSTYSGFVNGGGEGSSTTANGRFRISESYNWGSVSSRALIVRVSYGSFNISKS